MAKRPASDTIAAIATAPGTGGIGIVRISGPEAPATLRRVFVPRRPLDRFTSHQLYYGTVIAPDGQPLDEALAVHMHAPHTYTREDVVELHCHGSYLVLQEVLRHVLALGVRPAEQGEFTKRAFLAGRIDLTRAEAVMDLLQAQTTRSARFAVNQLQGQLADLLAAIRDELVNLLALLEVAIDFPDDDVEIFPAEAATDRLRDGIVGPLERLIAMSDQGRIVREGIKVVIAGRPNVGKSSLLNKILGHERVIVSNVAGTTRDAIEVRMEIAGLPVTFLDTAGLRETEDRLERAGIERALARAEAADLRLFLTDGSALPLEPTGDDLVVVGKADTKSGVSGLAVSGKTGAGVPELMARIGEILGERVGSAGALVRERHRVAVTTAIAALAESRAEVVRPDSRVELAAEHLRQAVRALDALVGRVDVDDLLGEIFASFCIGK